jgi:2-amino-1-hydroxyethylphosphonate dioxygenase (glycine-forming)
VNNKILNAIDQARQALITSAKSDYIGEAISQLEHGLQCGLFAKKYNHTIEVIIASLYHDIGHYYCNLSREQMSGLGVLYHEWIGARVVRELGFTKKTASLVRYHVAAKRYLAAKKTSYIKNLSSASKGTLDFQGGPMSNDEMSNFEKHPWFKEIIQVRANDEKGKLIGLELPTPELFDKEISYCLDQKVISRNHKQTQLNFIRTNTFQLQNIKELSVKKYFLTENTENKIILIATNMMKSPLKINTLPSELEGVIYLEPFLNQKRTKEDTKEFLNQLASSYIKEYTIAADSNVIKHLKEIGYLNPNFIYNQDTTQEICIP